MGELAPPRVGVLALQGAVEPHRHALTALGAEVVEVRAVTDLDGLDALVLPGGESTTISMLLERTGLFDPVADALRAGLPALGTCAGMILLGATVLDGRPDQRSFGVVDVDVRRNAFGRQVDSFEADLDVDGLAAAGLDPAPVHAVFIRAPVVERVGPAVEVLARVGDAAVVCRQGPVIVTSFHPELSGDPRIHELLLALVAERRRTTVEVS
ncbi:MAG TPA: pyridoxal 5'-phosphate synthase glutaminase subunit PdxT [Acidimicrobiales bacterium]|nr:pyridoxal 5'-phosphate synthase glutaminase subunit PdxT [Acidimicrobiales bacterium]